MPSDSRHSAPPPLPGGQRAAQRPQQDTQPTALGSGADTKPVERPDFLIAHTAPHPTGGFPAVAPQGATPAHGFHPTGGFPAVTGPHGAIPSPVPHHATPAHGFQPTPAHGFQAPPMHPTGGFPAVPSPGYTPAHGFSPTGALPAIDPRHQTGRHAIGDEGSHPIPPPAFTTGGFSAVSPLNAPFATGAMPAVSSTPHEGPKTIPDRVSCGIWGAAVGTIVGILLGMLNAFFEGVYPSQAQDPLIVFTLLGMLLGGGASAYAPATMTRLVKDLFLYTKS